ncbi:MAG: alpha/beta fold hydrolase [Actinomycetota bacterium]
MARIDDAEVSRVVSGDGTEIAYWTSGEGPPLVVVHGTPADHTRWRPLLPYLESHVTVHAMDRRGRGASGDGPEYRLTREFEDLAAVVDAIAVASGSSADVYGHSHGGIVAFGAATLTSNIRKLVLYEGRPVPNPDVYALPPGLEERMDSLLAEGNRDAVVETLFRELEAMSDEDMDAFRAAPSWPGRVAAAHTVTREVRAEMEARLDPELAARSPCRCFCSPENSPPTPPRRTSRLWRPPCPTRKSKSWMAKSTSRTSSSPRSSSITSSRSCTTRAERIQRVPNDMRPAGTRSRGTCGEEIHVVPRIRWGLRWH